MHDWNVAWSRDEGVARAQALFEEAFDRPPEGVWAAPGRVNLIGDHVDYNQGLCLPIALPHRTYVALAPRSDGRVRMVTGLDDGQRWDGSLSEIRPGGVADWVAYCAGPAWSLLRAGIDVPGFDLAIASCVPMGAGLSSSAAVECAVGLGLAELAGHPMGDDAGRSRLAQLCTEAENQVAGAPTGGMDQAASLRARTGHALLLDCELDTVTHVRLPLEDWGLELLVIDTQASHALSDGQYGQRRAACERAAALLGVDSLRQVAEGTDPECLDAVLSMLADPVLARRARHVVTEIWRVGAFVSALGAGDLVRAGRLMVQSHLSLRDDFEVSVRELDVVVDAALAAGALGARMTGGGFGGSAVALVPASAVRTVASAVMAEARRQGTPPPVIHRASASGPAERLL
nr:galactokinase [Raineyella antarctica]